MTAQPSILNASDWRTELPTLTARLVTLREPVRAGPRSARRPAVAGRRDPVRHRRPVTRCRGPGADRARRARSRAPASRSPTSSPDRRRAPSVGLMQVRQLDPGIRSRRMGMHARSVGARHAASSSKRRAWSGRSRSARSACTGSKRACCCRTAAPTARCASSAPSQEGVLRRSVRRDGEYFDQVLWSMLKEDWGDHWVSTGSARALMKPAAARCALYVAAVIAAGAGAVRRLPAARASSISRCCSSRLLVLSSATAALKVYLPLTTSGSTMSVSYAVDFASLLLHRPARDDARRRRQRVQPVPPEQQGTQPALSHAVQRGVARHHRARRRASRSTCSAAAGRGDVADGAGAAAGRRGDGVLPAQHRAGRDGDRAVDAATPIVSTWHNNFLWSAPSYFVGAGTAGARRRGSSRTPATGWRRSPSRRST